MKIQAKRLVPSDEIRISEEDTAVVVATDRHKDGVIEIVLRFEAEILGSLREATARVYVSQDFLIEVTAI